MRLSHLPGTEWARFDLTGSAWPGKVRFRYRTYKLQLRDRLSISTLSVDTCLWQVDIFIYIFRLGGNDDEFGAAKIRHVFLGCGGHISGPAFRWSVSIGPTARPGTSANHENAKVQAFQQQEWIYVFISNK